MQIGGGKDSALAHTDAVAGNERSKPLARRERRLEGLQVAIVYADQPRAQPQCTLKLAFVMAALLIGGCSMSKWTVKPHQRELLADKIMQLDAEPQEREAEEHVLANREGAIGGTGTSGGGCGCN